MKDDLAKFSDHTLSESFANSAQRTLSIDVKRYQEFLDGGGLTDEQKEEFLRAMLSIVVTFVDLGFSVEPMEEACGKDGETALPCSKTAFDQVRSEDQRNDNAKKNTGPSGGLEVT